MTTISNTFKAEILSRVFLAKWETGKFGNKFGEGSSTSDFDRFLKRVTVFAWHTKCVSENVFWKERHTWMKFESNSYRPFLNLLRATSIDKKRNLETFDRYLYNIFRFIVHPFLQPRTLKFHAHRFERLNRGSTEKKGLEANPRARRVVVW